MQTPRLALHKPHDVVRTQLRPDHRAVPKTLLEETAGERNIVDDRRLGKTTRLPEMFFICARTPFGGSCWARGGPLGGNRAFTLQKLKKMLQRSRIASRRLYM